MSGTSIFAKATSVTLKVYTSGSDDFSAYGSAGLLWTGTLVLGGSVNFSDKASWGGTQLTLSVDETGVVSLVSATNLSGGSGRKFLVMVAPAGVILSTCEWSQTVSAGNFSALYQDVITAPLPQTTWPDPEPVNPGITTEFGFAGGWQGF